MMLALFGTVVIAGIVGYASERSGFTQNGVVQSIIICVGGAFLFFFLRLMFGIDLSSSALMAITLPNRPVIAKSVSLPDVECGSTMTRSFCFGSPPRRNPRTLMSRLTSFLRSSLGVSPLAYLRRFFRFAKMFPKLYDFDLSTP